MPEEPDYDLAERAEEVVRLIRDGSARDVDLALEDFVDCFDAWRRARGLPDSGTWLGIRDSDLLSG